MRPLNDPLYIEDGITTELPECVQDDCSQALSYWRLPLRVTAALVNGARQAVSALRASIGLSRGRP